MGSTGSTTFRPGARMHGMQQGEARRAADQPWRPSSVNATSTPMGWEYDRDQRMREGDPSRPGSGQPSVFDFVRGALFDAHQPFIEAARVLEWDVMKTVAVLRTWTGFFLTGQAAEAMSSIGHYISACEKEAERCEKGYAKARKAAARMWASKATKNGGGEAHRFTKVPVGWNETLAPVGPHPVGELGATSDLAKVVEHELKAWTTLWKATFTPQETLLPWPVMERLMPFLEEEIRATCNSYKWRTGLGMDTIHPRHLGMCTDSVLHLWSYLFYCCECLGEWPSQLEFFAFYLQAKPLGGFRTIALLAGPYRIWAKARMVIVRKWAVTVPRSYFAAGTGKSTEDAVGRLLATVEAQDDDWEESACAIMDIDKCYEHVDHGMLIVAAIRHRFPLPILRLCLRMYRAARTLVWDTTYGKWVHATRSLVPGCSVAVYLLQVLMITPWTPSSRRTGARPAISA